MLTLQQLRSACAVVHARFNVSRAADDLHTTQSAVSKTIKALETDLGASIFARSSTRIVGLTDLGQGVVERARGILRESAAVLDLAQESTKAERGILTIGTAHTYARYLLPKIARAFSQKHPDVVVEIVQGDRKSIADWVAQGKAVMGITTLPAERPAGLAVLPGREMERCIVAPRGHEILSKHPPLLADVARHPLVTYPELFASSAELQTLFRRAGLVAKIAVLANDASVIKAHVRCGVGIALLQDIVIEPEDERSLGILSASHLLPPAVLHLIFRRDQYFRTYAYDFIEMFSPRWTKRAIEEQMRLHGASEH